ncbi:MAG: hypothetical protein PF637_02505 [Spirochaetes bacterium]|jgi:hypothetical protein|nr:hypothetical protein [Spirochaetota bacterium]
MIRFNAILFLLIFYLFYIPTSLNAQMPGWLSITDKSNNRYLVTPTGKIITTESPDFTYKPVSFEGIDYYLQQGIILSEKFNKMEGLLLLKSVRLLSSVDERVSVEGARASALIDRLRMREGDRFSRLNSNASLLMYKYNNRITVYSDYLQYSVTIDNAEISILKRAVRKAEQTGSDSFTAGIRFDTSKKGYDAILLVSSMEHKYANYKNVTDFQKHLNQRKGADKFERTVITERENYLLSSFEFSSSASKSPPTSMKDAPVFNGEKKVESEADEKNYFGFEVIMNGKKKGALLQIIAPRNADGLYLERLKKIAEKFTVTL